MLNPSQIIRTEILSGTLQLSHPVLASDNIKSDPTHKTEQKVIGAKISSYIYPSDILPDSKPQAKDDYPLHYFL